MMRPVNALVAYLNDYFAPEIWRPAADLLGNVTLSESDEFVRTLPLCDGLQDSRFDFSRPPSVMQVNERTIRINIPGVDHHHLETTIDVDKLPDADLSIDFRLQVDAGAGDPNSTVETSVGFKWGGTISDIALGLAGGPELLIAKAGIEKATQVVLAQQLKSLISDRLNGTLTYRFDREHDLRSPAGDPKITGVNTAGFRGRRDPQTAGYVDILIVADGFTAAAGSADVGGFDKFTNSVASYFANSAVLPFRSFGTDIRVWQLTLTVPPGEVQDPLQRCVVPIQLPDRSTFNFSNLARIAEIGLSARDYFGRDPIVVFATKVAQANLRENTQGPFVLLNVDGVPDQDAIDRAISTLIHELGHTPLGRYLADEYPRNASKTYHGLEPRPRNVTINPFLAPLLKWAQVSGNLINEGAYDFDHGVFSFAPTCNMREKGAGMFCAVCAEELTFGMLAHGHETVGLNGISGMIDLTIDYRSPWTQLLSVHMMGGEAQHLDVFDGGAGDHTTTNVRLTLAGSSVPKNWRVDWNVAGYGGFGTSGQLTGEVVDFRVVNGSAVELSVSHDLATGILGNNRRPPATSVRLLFDRARVVSAASLLPPVDLRQSLPVGGVANPVIDAATGAVRLPEPVWLEATIAGIQGLDLPTQIQFRAEAPGVHLGFHSAMGRRGEIQRIFFDHVPPAGQYVWSAQAIWRNLTSGSVQANRSTGGFCFEIGRLPFSQQPQAPVVPFDLQVLETATVQSMPSGLQASSWHPNDRQIKFQFEMKLVNQPWDGQGLLDTGLLDRDRSNNDSVKITGNVFFNVFPPGGDSTAFYKWRVRAVDDLQRSTDWVEGRQFAIYLVPRRPITITQLSHLLDIIDRVVLRAGGPIDVPRAFFIDDIRMGEKDTDFSGLDKWTRHNR